MGDNGDRRVRPAQFSLAQLMLAVTVAAIVARGVVAIAELESRWWIGCVWSIGPPLLAGGLLVVSLIFDSEFDAFVPGAVLFGWIGVLFGLVFGTMDGALGPTVAWGAVNCAGFGGAMTACSLGHLRGAAAMVAIGLYFPISVFEFVLWVGAS